MDDAEYDDEEDGTDEDGRRVVGVEGDGHEADQGGQSGFHHRPGDGLDRVLDTVSRGGTPVKEG